MKKKIWLLVPVVLAICAAVVVFTLQKSDQKKQDWEGRGTATFVPVEDIPGYDANKAVDKVSEEEKIVTEEQEKPEKEPYICPIDFETLQEENPDVYGWISIEGTDISYPLLQSEKDDTFYLNHGADGRSSSNGSIFSESKYNTKTMTDTITVLYGHRMRSGAMFGTLQKTYSSLEQLREYGEIMVYLPEQGYRYQVFAAVPYSNRHIMYTYGNNTARGKKAFLESINSVKSLDAYIDSEIEVSSSDTFLVLSTCLKGDSSRRFLVVAKQVEIL